MSLIGGIGSKSYKTNRGQVSGINLSLLIMESVSISLFLFSSLSFWNMGEGNEKQLSWPPARPKLSFKCQLFSRALKN